MPSTKAIDWKRRSRRLACLMGAAMLASCPGQMAFAHEGAAMNVTSNGGSTTELDARQQAIIPISASAAAGNMYNLRAR